MTEKIFTYNLNLLLNKLFYMPANKRPRRLNYAVNKKKSVTGGKVGNAVSHYKKLKKRVEIEGETKWLKNAMNVVEKKLQKYQINLNNI